MTMKSFVRISSLLWAEIFVNFALFVMQDYLTKVWNLNVTRAAAILNIWGAISKILPLFFLILVNTLLGNFFILAITSIVYSAGIGFVALSTPPVLGGATHTCKLFEPQCIGHVHKALFYAGMVLIALGKAGHSVSLNPFLEDQKDPQEGNFKSTLYQVIGLIMVLIVGLVGAIGLPYVKPWSIRFGVPAIITIFATILFFTGSCKYDKYEPEDSTVTTEDTKVAFRIIPILLTFLICGIVSSTSNTYFVEQASNMNRKIGKWSVPQNVFLLIIETAKPVFTSLTTQYLGRSRKRYAPSVGVAASMILSILCCITAARIETMRLSVIRKHNLIDKAEETIPMSMFWLSFQFLLLAGLNSVLEISISEFYKDQCPESMTSYLENLSKATTGLGYIGAVVTVYVVGRVSEKGGKTSWFQDTLNRSRLDNYYWVLAVLSSANLIVFVVVACSYRYQHRRTPEEQAART